MRLLTLMQFKKFIKNAVSSEVDTTANIIGDETERILMVISCVILSVKATESDSKAEIANVYQQRMGTIRCTKL